MNYLTCPPTLSVLTTYLHESDREEAAQLGTDLFNLLTRPTDDWLGYGAGIPVLSAVEASRVALDSAETVVVIPVLGTTAFFLRRREILKQLNAWHKTFGVGNVLIVPMTSQWRAVESQLPSKQFLSELYGDGDRRHRTLGEILLALTRVLQDDQIDDANKKSPQLFISHAKADISYTNVAKVIQEYIVGGTTGHAFFDTTQLIAGQSLSDQLDSAVSRGVLLAIRGDAYSSRSWCQRELLTAKQHGVPTLVVEVLKEGEKRSSPYAGNAPTIVWHADSPSSQQAAEIVLRALVEWLRAAHFKREGEARIKQVAKLPIDTAVLSRPPELLDVAQGRINPQGVVLYPDPELPVTERQILRAAYPRLQTMTPTTAFRRMLGSYTESKSIESDAPLEGQQVAISISNSPDVDGPEGFTKYHLDDAILYLARTLVSSGAAIAYGGDFRVGGYTEQFCELIMSYNETASEPGNFLQLYQEATVELGKVDQSNLTPEVHHLSELPAALVPVGEKEFHLKPLYLSDMRRVMAERTLARIVVGGKTTPKLYDSDTTGYSGIYPGVVEEAWRTLEAKKPLYVIGGFGGAAAVVADLLAGKAVPPLLRSKTWKNSKVLFPLQEVLHQDKYFKKLKLPATMEVMAERVRAFGKRVLKSDKTALNWNGLTKKENLALFRLRDPLRLATLVLKGLLAKNRKQAQGKLKIELVHGSVTRAERLNAIAVATFDDIPLGGAGAALDRAGGGRASAAHAQGEALVKLNAPSVDADWLYLASLGPVGKATPAKLVRQVRAAAEATRDIAQRHRFWRLGVVTFGGAVVEDIQRSAKALLEGLCQLGDEYTVTWFETDKDQFEKLDTLLRKDERVALTTKRVQADFSRPPVRDESIMIQVGLSRQKLTATTLPPAGTAIASANVANLTDSEMAKMCAGEGFDNRETPSQSTLEARGAALTKLMLGDQADELLEKCGDKRIVIVHDSAASQLPFEYMTLTKKNTPLVTRFGISRRLAVSGVGVEQLFSRAPKSGQLNLLLIVNPTGDLPGTIKEAKQVDAILKPLSRSIKLKKLVEAEATVDDVRKALALADIVHYCGHAFFDKTGIDSSGLILAGKKPLTLKEMRSAGTLPRMAFFNACEAARVRGVTPGIAASKAFAEYFLRAGVEAYLGTYWQVSDAGAAKFATHVYSGLAGGMTLDHAVQNAQIDLHSSGSNEWANYILYGNGAFRLLNQQSG